MKQSLSILVHGESGVGKSWLGDTAPYPRLIIDLEGRAKYTPSGPKRAWDPRAEAPPMADGSWGTCIVTITDFDQLQLVYQWLRSGQHQFKSVVIDSVMEAQKRCIDSVSGVSALQTQDWGEVLRKLEALVRSYRDLTLIESNPVEVVCFIVGSVDQDGVRRPLLQGQLKTTIPYYIDVVGYMFMNPTETGLVRSMLVNPDPGYVAKDGTNRLPGPVIANPSLKTIYEGLAQDPNPVVPVTVPQEVPAA